MLPHMGLKALVVVGLLAGVAHAGPTSRFGLTYGVVDPAASSVELGPMVSLGERAGGFVGELEWAYLSFIDPEASRGGVHRLGVTLRADLAQWSSYRCWGRWACSHGRAFYAEAGAAERYGHWTVDAFRISPINSPQPEAHIGLGFELDNQLSPYRNGWQLGIRFAIAPSDPTMTTACRGTNCMTTVSGGGTQKAVLLEWMFVVGK
jgi:hypothetical protein